MRARRRGLRVTDASLVFTCQISVSFANKARLAKRRTKLVQVATTMPTPAQRRRQQEVGGKIGAVGWERPQSGALGQQRQQKQLVAAKVGSVD